MRLAAFLAFILIAVPLPARAQETWDENSCTRAWDGREYSPVKGIESAVAVTRSASLVFDCDVISIYFRYSNWDKQPAADTPRVYHFARLISVRDGKAAELWADGRKCPALGEALKSLAVIEPPRIEIPGYTQPATGPLRIQIDGDGFRLSDRLGPEFSGNQASPLGQWTYATLKSLAPCLSAQKPSFG